MPFESVTSLQYSAGAADRYFAESNSSGQPSADSNFRGINRQAKGKFLLLKLPEMIMLDKMLLTHERAPIQLLLAADLIAGYEGSYHIQFSNGRSARLTIKTIYPDVSHTNNYIQPPLTLVETSIPGILNEVRQKTTEIILYPDTPWLTAMENYHIFHFDIAELFAINTSCMGGSRITIMVMR